MILRGAQIHWDGHGKSGLLPNPTLFKNNTPLPSTVCFRTRVSSTESVFFLQLEKGGGATPRSDYLGVETHFM